MLNLFKEIDFCSNKPELLIDKRSNKKSLIGGLISLLIVLTMIFLSFYLGIDMIRRKKPKVVLSEILPENPTIYNLTTKDYMIGHKIVDIDNNPFPNYKEYLDILVLKQSGNIVSSTTTTVFQNTQEAITEFVKCNEIEDYKSLTAESRLSSYFCQKDFNIELGGYYTDNKYRALRYIISPCSGKSYCRSEEEIKEFMDKGILFVLFYGNTMIDPTKEDPFVIEYTPQLYYLSNLFYINQHMYFKNIEVKTDAGFLFESFNYNNFFVFDVDSTYYSSRSASFKFIDVFMFIKKNTLVYHRSYLKIQELAANIGGLLKFLCITSSIFLYPISNKAIKIDLMNEMFEFTKSPHDSSGLNNISLCNLEPSLNNKENKSNSISVNAGLTKNNLISNSNAMAIIKDSESGNEDNYFQNINHRNINSRNINAKADLILKENSSVNHNSRSKAFKDNLNFSYSKLDNVNNINNNINTNNNFNIKNNNLIKVTNLSKIESNVNNNSNNISTYNINKEKLIRSLKNNINENKRLIYSYSELIYSIFCFIKICKPSKTKFKDNQYNLCLDEVTSYTNLNFIINKMKEIEFIKAVVFNREQSLAFNFLSKPLVNDTSTYLNKAINLIHYDNFKINNKEKLNKLTNYLVSKDNSMFDKIDVKILELLDVELEK